MYLFFKLLRNFKPKNTGQNGHSATLLASEISLNKRVTAAILYFLHDERIYMGGY